MVTQVEIMVTGVFKDRPVRVYLRRGGQVRHTIDLPAGQGRGVIKDVEPGADWQISYQWRERFNPSRKWKTVMIAPVNTQRIYLYGDY